MCTAALPWILREVLLIAAVNCQFYTVDSSWSFIFEADNRSILQRAAKLPRCLTLDPKIPFAKAKVVAALTQPYTSNLEALQAIATSPHSAYPDPSQADPLIAEAQAIYRKNFFPDMKTDWRTHPNNIGHKDWNGCFSCHDGNHQTADGKKTIAASDCNSCHLILAQGSGEQLKKLNVDGYTFFHIDSEFSEFSCTTCHTGGPRNNFCS